MSGGSYNYLYCRSLGDLIEDPSDLERMRDKLISLGYPDIAKDTQRLIEYTKSSACVIETLQEKLKDVFHDVEWRSNGDIGDKRLIETLEEYRLQGGHNKQ